MKISKYTALIKKKGYGVWINSENKQECYLATSASVYKAHGLPYVDELEVAKAILDIDKKAEKKIMLKLEYKARVTDVLGFDLSDGKTEGEKRAEHNRAAAVIDDIYYSVLRCQGGELIFYDRALLAPLKDRFKDKEAAEYINYAIRYHMRSGDPYVVVKDGFETLAAILPVRVLSEDYISELQDFQLMCMDQLHRERAREKAKENMDGVQEVLPGIDPKKDLSDDELQDLADRACELDRETAEDEEDADDLE